jgi:RNA processing factor Prp31
MAAIHSAAPVAIAARAGFHSSAPQAASLRETEQRIKSVKNIEKITKVGRHRITPSPRQAPSNQHSHTSFSSAEPHCALTSSIDPTRTTCILSAPF